MSISLINQLMELRLKDPYGFTKRVAQREPTTWKWDQPIMMIAADHPARGSFAVGEDPKAMADYEELLQRCVRALSRPGVNGFLGTSNIVADLANLGALDRKIVFGSMNRSGFVGSCFENDDRVTGYNVKQILSQKLDGGKMLVHYDFSDSATVNTVESCAKAINELGENHKISLVEPFISYRNTQGILKNDLAVDAVVKSVALTAGLGAISSFTWLKLPAINQMHKVVNASALPILLLGGEVYSDMGELRQKWAQAMSYRSIRGMVVGRAMLYPSDGDIEGAVDRAVELLEGLQ